MPKSRTPDRWPCGLYPPFLGICIDLDLWVRGGGLLVLLVNFFETAPIEGNDAEAKDT